MKPPVQFVLPFPPSVNRIWRCLGCRIVLSAAARAWIKAAHNALPAGPVPVPLKGRLRVRIDLYAPRELAGRPWDIFNREKLLCDFLTKERVWLDDSQIDEGLIVRGLPDVDGAGQVIVNIREIH